MKHQVSPAHEEDISRLIDIQFAAFGDDPTHQLLYPGDQFSTAVRANASERTLKSWQQTSEMHMIKCEERSTGVITGFAKWVFYKSPHSEERWNVKPTAPWAEGTYRTIVEQLLATTAEIRGRMWQGNPHAGKLASSHSTRRSSSNPTLVLGLLCVHPDFQRQGIGKDLVQWGLQRAACLGLTVHLEASPEGLPLYRSLNFKIAETVVVGADQWDGRFERKYVVMLRVPTRVEPENAQHYTFVKNSPCADAQTI